MNEEFIDADCNAECAHEHNRIILAAEAAEPLAWWWLSFCDPDRPKGEFLGACLVKANGPLSGTLAAHALGINPGGEVLALGPVPLEAPMREGWAERLLTRAECEEFDRVHEGLLK